MIRKMWTAGLLLAGVVAFTAPADMLKEYGITGGFVVHVGCGDGKLTASLRESEAFVVHGLDTDAQAVEAARTRFGSIDHRGMLSAAEFDGKNLPYIDNMVNLIVVSGKWQGASDEFARVLAPRGVLLTTEPLATCPSSLAPQSPASGDWHVYKKAVPPEIDEWHHYLHDADNNAVSSDSAIKPPISHLQWRGSPIFSRHHDKSATHLPGLVSARGRIFYIKDNGPLASVLWPANVQLIARDAFNGVVLWQKKIDQWIDHLAYGVKQGPAVNPRRLVAIGESVYVTLGVYAPVSKLDARTGRVLKTYAGTEKTEEILIKDGVMVLVVNPTVSPEAPAGFILKMNPKKVLAVDEATGRILWEHEVSWIAPSTLTIGKQNVYLCNGPDILAYDQKTGKKLWKSQELPWRERMPTYFAPTMVAAPGGVLYAGGEGWKEHAGSKGLMTFLNAADGSIKWQAPHLPSGYQSPQDIFIIRGKAWCGSLNSKPGEFDTKYPEVAPSTGDFVGYSLESGSPDRMLAGNNDSYWFHHRCHRAKATENYFLTSRTGIEMIDTKTGEWSLHHWVRGACLYGIMPANGLIYAPPHPCACYPESKLPGFNAVSGPRAVKPAASLGKVTRLLKGPAFGNLKLEIGNLKLGDWATYRGNPARSGSTKQPVTSDFNPKWELELGGKLTPPVVAGGKVFVADKEHHAVAAIDQATGKLAWRKVVGARIDSPPTWHKGFLLFGCTDGHVYCLRASDGELAWRFRAAPYDQRHMVYEQLESVWPVHGSVLIRAGVAYFTAGRSAFLEGGMVLYRLNPLTGEVLSEEKLTKTDPLTGEDITSYIDVLSMPAGSSDIMSSEGDYVFMRSQPFDLKGKRHRVKQAALKDQRGPEAHLFAANGLLDDSWWHRSFWQYGRAVRGGPSYWETGNAAPAGKIMVLDDDNLYIYGRKPNLWKWTVQTEYSLFCVDRSLPAAPERPAKKKKGKRKSNKIRSMQYLRKWDVDIPFMARAMVKAGDVVFAAGPADIVDEFAVGKTVRSESDAQILKKQAELFEGSDGSILWAVSARTGQKIAETKLDVLPVFDGMVAAGGRIYMSTVDGKVVCLGAGKMDFQALEEQTGKSTPHVGQTFLSAQTSENKFQPLENTQRFVPGAGDILIADFEGDSYGVWKVEGEAFGTRPAIANRDPKNRVAGYLGTGLVNSFRGKDKSTGKLTSPEFKIERKHINFLLCAGNHDGQTCINLLVDGKVVRTANGPGKKNAKKQEELNWRSWDVSEFAGKRAVIEIVDNHKGGWGHIDVDHIVQSDRASE